MLPHNIAALMHGVAELTVTMMLEKTGAMKIGISKQEAYRQYGRPRVDRWIRERKIRKTKKDNWEITRSLLESLRIAEDNPSFNSIKVRL
ncbi:hypothetical protein [Pedobacter cryoconitis]|nr:hypothetical protein [Pedobacter cryoconitis]